MLSNHSLLKKEDLEIDLRELGKEILRELFLCSRRLTLYAREHQAENEVTKKPFNWLKKLFRLRSYFDFHLYQGELYTMGIPQNEEVFIRGLKSELSRFSLGSVFIYSQVSPDELVIFLRRMTEKLHPLPKHLDLQRFLEEKKVSSIRIKRAEKEDPFTDENISLIEKCGDFEAGTLARLSLREDPGVMLDMLLKKIRKDIDLEGRVKLDFKFKVFQSVLLEEFSRLPQEKVKELLEGEFEKKNWEEVSRDEVYLDGVKNLVKAFIHHPERDSLFVRLREIFVRNGAPDNFLEKALDESALLKIKTLKDSESLLERLACGEFDVQEVENLKNLLVRLINLNQAGLLKKTFKKLLNNLFSDQEKMRNNSLSWLKILADPSLKHSRELFGFLVQELLLLKERTNAQSLELLEYFAEKAITNREYWIFNLILQDTKIELERNHSSEKEERFKNLVQKFSVKEVVEQLAGEIKRKRNEVWDKAGDSLALIGGEKVFKALEDLLIDPDRTIRMMVLKIAGKTGEEGAIYFTRVLRDESNFQRDQSGNLTLDSWFKIRNTLHILADLKSEKALEELGKRLNDPDHKVRKAVIQTLEKIGGKKCQEFLLTLAQDEDKEIKNLALMALVSCGSEDSIDKLEEFFYKDKEEAIPILQAINNIGGEKASNFLMEVINQGKIFEWGILSKNKDQEIKLEAIKALKKRKDFESQEQMEKLKEKYVRMRALFDKSSQLNESLRKVLERIYK
jgi:HEAT repeat protein